MTTLSARLGLKRHTTADRFHIQDYFDNWTALDASPGALICTSTSRPTTWAAANTGQRIIETDTGLVWRWTGTAFARQGPAGLQGRVTRTTDLSTSSTSLVTALTLAVPLLAGQRTLQVSVEGPGVYNTAGLTSVAIFRDSTQIAAWSQQGKLGATFDAQPTRLNFTTFDLPSTAPTYTLQFAAVVGYGGTSTLQGQTNSPLGLTVVEV